MKKNLKKYSIVIAGIILILAGLYLILYPFFPKVYFSVKQDAIADKYYSKLDDIRKEYTEKKEKPQSQNHVVENTNSEKPITATDNGNRIIIPAIGVDINLIASDSENYALENGAWLMPLSDGISSEGYNVITAHRFKYRPPASNTFYHLDKIKVNDEIFVFENYSEYQYKVTGTELLAKDDEKILQYRKNNTLVLFTCHPLFSTDQRYYVIAAKQ